MMDTQTAIAKGQASPPALHPGYESLSNGGSSEIDESQCHFLGLPPELRNRIYELTLKLPSRIKIETFRPCEAGRQPPLTRTCRQIRSESLAMFYHCNTFDFISRSSYTKYEQLRFGFIESYIPDLRHISISSSCHDPYFELEIKDSGEWSLGIDVGFGSCLGCSVSKVLSDCFAKPTAWQAGHEFLKACGIGEGSGLTMDANALEELIRTLENPPKRYTTRKGHW